MNYARIYAEFINDRKSRQPQKPDYFEKHHIVPRSLGGGNEAENLIRLTPEDHYFAHLCLAKIHSGAQWAGVLCMARMLISTNRENVASIYAKRKMVGVARRMYAEHRSNSQTGVKSRHKRKLHTIFNIDGRSFTGVLSDLSEFTGVGIASISRLANKKQGRTHDGWYMFHDEYTKSIESSSKTGLENSRNVRGANKRPIICNETGDVFESVSAASIATGATVKNAFKPGRKKAGGYTWAYI